MTPIIIQQNSNNVQIIGSFTPVFNFTPFAITATMEGQTQFTLPTIPNFVIIMTIQGVVQSQLAGDFTLAGSVVTFSEGIGLGELIAGIYV